MPENTWPGGKRHAMYPDEHEKWNTNHYPGTRQMCSVCEEPTGRCVDDTIWSDDGEPLCEDCFNEQEHMIIEKQIAREYGVV